MTPAKQAAAEIRTLLSERSAKTTRMATEQMELIIQRAISSSQRPYVEWIMKADHHSSCPGLWRAVPEAERRDCTCGLVKLRDELRKQVGGES